MIMGFLVGANGKEPTCQCRRRKRYRFNPWVRKMPWKRFTYTDYIILTGLSTMGN